MLSGKPPLRRPRPPTTQTLVIYLFSFQLDLRLVPFRCGLILKVKNPESRGCSCSLLLLQTPNLSSSFCGRSVEEARLGEKKSSAEELLFPGPRDTKPWVRKLRILSPKRHRNFSTFRQQVLPPPTSHPTFFTNPPMTIRAQTAEIQ